MMRFRHWHEEKVNSGNLQRASGGSNAIECMRENGAQVMNIYKLLMSLSRGETYPNAVFLGLEQENLLLKAIAGLAHAIHWEDAQRQGFRSFPGDAPKFLNEAIRKGKTIFFFLPTNINARSGFTLQEFNWLVSHCNNPQIMRQVIIVLGLYNIVSNEELLGVLYRGSGRVDLAKLRELLANWQGNVTRKPSTPGFVTSGSPRALRGEE